MAEKLILLIEDSPDDAALALRALKKGTIDHRAVVVGDGEEALEYLFRRGRYSDHADPLPDVILLDLKLPKVDGLEVLKQLRAEAGTGLIPVVALTSSREEKDLALAYRLGVNSFIVKPVDIADFTAAVQQVCTYWLTVNQVPNRV